MRQAAVHDALTGLPNRKLILDRLTQALARRRRDDRDLYVMFIDLDGFKRVNDELGHQAGDQILIGVAGRLNEVVRETDTVGRLAGDEFVVICEHTTPDTATTVAHRITAALSEPFQIDGRGVRVGASLGLTSPDADIDDPEQVLAHADSAMYVAKAQPGSSVATFHRSQRATHLQRRSLERDLEGAVERGELTVVFQPLWDLQAAATVGAEALLRWDHPTSGLLDADRFVPVAAESDLILTLGTWTLEQAVGHLATRQDEIDDGMPWTLYVNLSVRELSDATLPERVEHLLDGAAIRPDRLGFDIPEDAVLDERVAATASSLHALGVRLALDDFGAATTSLAQLHVLPWHVIKLDGALIARAVGDHDARAVVRAVSSLAHHLGIQVLAEQVETAAQEAALPDLGCDLGQGVRFHAPAEAADLTLPRSDPSERTSAGPAPR